jgi:hypothetical protein
MRANAFTLGTHVGGLFGWIDSYCQAINLIIYSARAARQEKCSRTENDMAQKACPSSIPAVSASFKAKRFRAH